MQWSKLNCGTMTRPAAIRHRLAMRAATSCSQAQNERTGAASLPPGWPSGAMAGRGEGFRTMGTHTAASAEVSGVGGARARRHGDHECGKGEEEGRDAHVFVRTGVGSTGGRNTAALADNVELQILLAELSGGRMCRRCGWRVRAL